MVSAGRLPGIYFETVVPPVAEPLPRMDIAALVGFAPSGPLNVPVAVESSARFQEIFGIDQPLGWDSARGTLASALLPPSVRSFFRNGGTRCWIVRVADDSTALSNVFLVPGLLQAEVGVPCEGGSLEARSEGSWSDDYMVNATLSFAPLEIGLPLRTTEGLSFSLLSNPVTPVSPGDLVQLSFDTIAGSPAEVAGPLLLAEVTSVETQTTADGNSFTNILCDGLQRWFHPASSDDFASVITSPDSTTSWLPEAESISWLTQPAEIDLPVGRWSAEQTATGTQFAIEAPRDQAESITPGSWIRIQLPTAELPALALNLLLLVDSVRGSAAADNSGTNSPSTENEMAEIVGSSAWWLLDGNAISGI